MDQTDFEAVQARAERFEYSALSYVDAKMCAGTEVLRDDEALILLRDADKSPPIYHWATNDPEVLIVALGSLSAHLNFVPASFVEPLKEAGFVLAAEILDMLCPDLESIPLSVDGTVPEDYMTPDDIDKAVAVSERCEGFSRSFPAENAAFFAEWLAEDPVIVTRDGEEITGFACITFFKESKTVFLVEIAVSPERMGQGIGRMLVHKALCCGIERGAKQGFLHVDAENIRAMRLYESCGFVLCDGEPEIQMERKGR